MSSNNAQDQISAAPSLRSTWTKRLIVALTILVFIVIGWIALYATSLISNALIVLIISALLAYMIYTFIKLLQRGLSRPLAVTFAYLVVGAALTAILYFVLISVVSQSSSSLQVLQNQFGPRGQRLVQLVTGFLGQFGISPQQVDLFRNNVFSQLQGIFTGIIAFLTRILSNIITSIIIVTLSVYFVLDGPRMVRWLANKTPLAYRDSVNFLVHTLDCTVGGYFRALPLLAAIGAVCTAIVLSLLHVPFATLLGLVFFLLFFIPMIGGYVSGALCILAAIPQEWVTVIVVIIFTFLLQQIILGQILAPRIFSHSIGLHPIVALFALLAGSQLFGVLGGFFSVPVAGVIQEVTTAFWKNGNKTIPFNFRRRRSPLKNRLQ